MKFGFLWSDTLGNRLKKTELLLSFKLSEKNHKESDSEREEESQSTGSCKLTYLPITFILLLILIVALFPYECPTVALPPCQDECQISIVESIPEGLAFNTSQKRQSTFQAWSELIDLAQESIDQAGMYWTLRGTDVYEDQSDWAGEKIFNKLVAKASKNPELLLRIAQNMPSKRMPNLDTEFLEKNAGAKVRSVNFTKLMGAGILHTKLWIVDRKHFYVGSANFDWRSLTQVKEVGVLVKNCPCLAEDIAKIWEVYWFLGQEGSDIPAKWPATLETKINQLHPLNVTNFGGNVFMTSSPPPFCPSGRSGDGDSIVALINEAEKFVRVAVMDYFPSTIYGEEKLYWPNIDDALRRAAVERGVVIELLMSKWAHTRPAMLNYLRSLRALHGMDGGRVQIHVKLFTVPAFTPDQARIPFGRVNHNKYMVTDKAGYIGTSNWSADYFISTGGIGFVFDGALRQDLVDLFLRDWNSSYARLLE